MFRKKYKKFQKERQVALIYTTPVFEVCVTSNIRLLSLSEVGRPVI